MIIPKLFIERIDPETGKTFISPCTLADLQQLEDEYFDAAMSLGALKEAAKEGK